MRSSTFVAIRLRFLLGFALFLLGIHVSAARPAAAGESEPPTVDVGMFAASVYELDFYEGTYKTIFWVWFVHDDPDYNPLEAIEVTNARDYEIMESYGRKREDGRHYVAAKMRAEINQPWDISDFPFDSQRLDIVLESVGKDARQLSFKADSANSVNGPELDLSGWSVRPIESETSVFRYNTTFGEESAERLAFPRITFTIPIQRDNPKLFFEAYIGYIIAFMMCGTIWLTTAAHMPDYRIGMILAATFAAIGNKNVLESNYPSSPTLGLEDQIEICTFLLIALSLLLAVGCERLHLSGRAVLAERMNMRGFPVLLAAYLLAFAYFVLNAAYR